LVMKPIGVVVIMAVVGLALGAAGAAMIFR
jgi:hypothetical protein